MNMFSFSITAKAITASFRVPETHTFHQTLPLPPKTTIIGMIGAALGKRLNEAHAFVETTPTDHRSPVTGHSFSFPASLIFLCSGRPSSLPEAATSAPT